MVVSMFASKEVITKQNAPALPITNYRVTERLAKVLKIAKQCCRWGKIGSETCLKFTCFSKPSDSQIKHYQCPNIRLSDQIVSRLSFMHNGNNFKYLFLSYFLSLEATVFQGL